MHAASVRRPSPLLRLLIGVLALAAAAGLAVVPARPAAAATIGPGWGPQENDGLGFIGAFVVEGRQVYCAEPTLPAPLGATDGPAYGGWGGSSPDDLARVSWAIATTGQSPDRRDTAAVALFVWSVLAPGSYGSHPLPGDEWYARRVPDPDDRSVVLGTLARLRAEAAAITAAVGPGSGSISLTIDPVDEYTGTLVLSGISPAGAVGTLSLQNAVFDTTGTGSIAGVRDGASLAITGLPPHGATPYRVEVDGSFAVTGAWGGELAIWSTADSQTLAGPGRPVDLVFPLAAVDVRDRSVVFQPTVATLAEPRVLPGQRYRDVLRFALAPDANGRVNRWFRSPDGDYLPVTASCRVYGPFPAPPIAAAGPPPGAPLASSFVVTTGPEGPEADYPVDSEQHLAAPGWYTTQCSIDAGSQPGPTRPFLPAGYRYEDGFGVAEENAVVPFQPTLATTFADRAASPGEWAVDAVTVGVAEGPWLLDDAGAPVPIEIEGRFSVVDDRPELDSLAPSVAEEVAVQRLTVTGPGTYEAQPVLVPDDGRWLVAQWCVIERVDVQPVCDEWGEIAETVAILPPSVDPPSPPRLAVTGTDGSGLAAGAGIALALLGSGVLLRVLSPLREPRRLRAPAIRLRSARRARRRSGAAA